MTKRKQAQPPAVQTTLEDLAALVKTLTKQVETLWLAVDDLREEIFAEFQHLRGEPPDQEDEPAATPPFHLTSMPRDPCDPDFHKKVNTAGAGETRLLAAVPATLDQFLAQMIADPVSERVSSVEWNEDQQYPRGKVLEIDADIFDWFADCLVTVHQGADCFVLADGDGLHYALWTCGQQCFVRRFRTDDESTFSEFEHSENERSKSEDAAAENSVSEAPERTGDSQGTLW